MKMKNILVIIIFVLFSLNITAQEISAHFSFTTSSNPRFNGAMGVGGEIMHYIWGVPLGITFNKSGVYKTIISNYTDKATGNIYFDNQYSNMLCSEFAIFKPVVEKGSHNSRLTFGPIIGFDYIRRLGSVQRFYNPKDLRYYTFFKYDDKNYQSKFGFYFEAEVRPIFETHISFFTKIKGLVSGIEYWDFSDPRNPNSFANLRFEVGLRFTTNKSLPR